MCRDVQGCGESVSEDETGETETSTPIFAEILRLRPIITARYFPRKARHEARPSSRLTVRHRATEQFRLPFDFT